MEVSVIDDLTFWTVWLTQDAGPLTIEEAYSRDIASPIQSLDGTDINLAITGNKGTCQSCYTVQFGKEAIIVLRYISSELLFCLFA